MNSNPHCESCGWPNKVLRGFKRWRLRLLHTLNGIRFCYTCAKKAHKEEYDMSFSLSECTSKHNCDLNDNLEEMI